MNPTMTKQKMLHFDAISLLQLEARATCENEKAFYQAKYAETMIELTKKPIDYALNNAKVYEGEENPVGIMKTILSNTAKIFNAQKDN